MWCFSQAPKVPFKGKNSTRVERSLAFPSYPFPVPQMELNFWLRPCAKQSQNPYFQSRPPPLYQVNLPIRMMGNWKRIFGNLLSPLGSQNKDITWLVHSRLQVVSTHQLLLQILIMKDDWGRVRGYHRCLADVTYFFLLCYSIINSAGRVSIFPGITFLHIKRAGGAIDLPVTCFN